MPSSRVYIVEDEAIVAADLADRLARLGFGVAGIADTGARALAEIPSSNVDVVLMDIVLKGALDGVETSRRLRRLCDLPLVYLTSHADQSTVQAAVDTEPYGYVLKPFNDRELEVALRIAVHRHGVESRLRHLESWMATLLASIGDGVVAADMDGSVTLLNAAAERLTGWGGDEALGKPLDEVLQLVSASSSTPITGLVERGAKESFELGVQEPVLLQRRAGDALPIDDSVAPIRHGEGPTSGVVLVFRDATQRLAAERLRSEKLAAELASDQKTRFLSRMSHELRNPLNAILGFTQLLQEDRTSPLTPAQRQRLGMLQAAGQRLLALVNDVLDLSRIEQNQLRLNLEAVAVADVLARACDLVAGEAAQADVVVERPQVAGTLRVKADRRAFDQIAINLLSNGIKYNRHGGRLRVEVTSAGDVVEIAFTDQGPGLSTGQLSQLFQPFNRLGAENSAIPGSGLGLVIAKSLAEAMHCQLSAASTADGTRFSLRMPRMAADSAGAQLAEPSLQPRLHDAAAPAPATLLYIEDDPVNALLFTEALASVPQWRVLLAEDGLRGLQMARRLLPDLVVTDINLPGLTGNEIVCALRADAVTRKLRCIALSADALADQVAAAEASGFDDYWTKPLDLSTLVERIQQCLSTERQ